MDNEHIFDVTLAGVVEPKRLTRSDIERLKTALLTQICKSAIEETETVESAPPLAKYGEVITFRRHCPFPITE